MKKSEQGKAAAAVGEREGQLAALAQHLLLSAENEKAQLARELHSELGAFLTVASLDVSMVLHKLKQSEPELAVRLQRVLGKIKEAAAFKRQIVESLRPSMLDGLGLPACLSQHAAEFGKRTGLHVTTDLPDVIDLSPDHAIAMFRIAQQALDNVEQHAHASEVNLSLREQDSGLVLLIADDGTGLPHDVLASTASLGLIGMRERAALFGGRLTLHRRDEGGTAVEAWLPQQH
jgi:signal transduction histidine kinase